MTPERWQRVDKIFQTAADMNPAQRETFLNASCGDDQELRSEVESLLSCDEEGLSIIDEPAYQVAAGLLVNEKPQLAEDQQIGHYTIAGLIGKGGMGEVYAAEDMRLKRRIALKLLPMEYTKHKDRLRRFQQEAQTASALNHPNILTIHELGEVNGKQFIATEFVEGETLRERMKRTRLNLAETLDIASQVASALAAAHKAGIVHRDIKPENIMLRPDGYVKVLDFGLAKLAEQPEPTLMAHDGANVNLSSGLLMGTVSYMSPEQARAEGVDARSDIFSFGVVLYHMVTGRTPFEGDTTKDLIAAILNTEPQAAPGVPDDLFRIIRTALRKNRRERYQTVEDLLVDLKGLNQRLELEVKFKPSPPDVSIVTSRGRETLDATGTIQYAIRERRRSIAAIAAVAVILIAAVGFGLFRFVRPRRAAASFMNIKVTRLTTSGDVWRPIISADGKYVCYGRKQNEKVSLWLRDLAANSEHQILEPVDAEIEWGGGFSPDDNYVYYAIAMNPGLGGDTSGSAIYRIPISGGTPSKLPLEGYGVTVSPDGKRLAYTRMDGAHQQVALLTANIDGTDERVITSGGGGAARCAYPSWSPRGTTIACGTYSSTSHRIHIAEIDVATGTEKSISSEQWDNITGLAWLPDASGLIVGGSSGDVGHWQVWHLSYPSGEIQRVTNDFSTYEGISVGSNGNSLLAAQFENQSRVWRAPVDLTNTIVDVTRAKQVSLSRFDGRVGLAFAPDGKIVFAYDEDRPEIWMMDADGQNRQRLADNGIDPTVSSDGRYVVFGSRIGRANIWRVDTRDWNLKQLTNGQGEYRPSVSSDGQWVVYESWESGSPTIWKVSIDGGHPTQISNKQARTPVFSPDGQFIAYGYWTEKSEPKAALIRSDGGEPIKVFSLPSGYVRLGWTPDSKALTFLFSEHKGPGNLWVQPLDNGPLRKLTNFTTERLMNFAWSNDGAQVALARVTSVRDVVLISNLR